MMMRSSSLSSWPMASAIVVDFWLRMPVCRFVDSLGEDFFFSSIVLFRMAFSSITLPPRK